MSQIFDVTANENALYKHNELEWQIWILFYATFISDLLVLCLIANRIELLESEHYSWSPELPSVSKMLHIKWYKRIL